MLRMAKSDDTTVIRRWLCCSEEVHDQPTTAPKGRFVLVALGLVASVLHAGDYHQGNIIISRAAIHMAVYILQNPRNNARWLGIGDLAAGAGKGIHKVRLAKKLAARCCGPIFRWPLGFVRTIRVQQQ